ncbi:MAG: hypothetical protein ACPG4T_01095 [Nannocystaceae bacterium]
MALVATLGVAVASRLPGLGAGYALDDFAHLAMLSGEYPLERAWWDLFNFVDGSADEVAALQAFGSLPWWSDPGLRLAAFRPLASGLTAVDTWVFGHHAFAAHLHSLLWWLGLLGAYLGVLRRFLPGPAVWVGLALFALDASHTLPLAWLANRNALICGLGVLLAVGFHVGHRESSSGGLRHGSTLFVACALLAGEQGVSAILCMVAYEVVAGQGPWRSRLRALAPGALVTAAYLMAHLGLGYGARQTAGYLDPFGEVLAFATAAPGRFCGLLGEVVLGVPAMASAASSWVFGLGVAAGVMLAVCLAAVPDPWRRHSRWLAAATCLSLLPGLASPPSSRLLVVASLWWSGVVGLAFYGLWQRRRDTGFAKLAGRGVVASLVLIHAVAAPVWGYLELRGFCQLAAGLESAAEQAPVQEQQPVVVVRTRDIAAMLYSARSRHEAGHSLAPSWWTLSAAPGPHTLIAHAPNRLELVIPDGLLASPTARFFRRSPGPAVGDVVSLDHGRLQLTPLEAGNNGPTRIAITCRGSCGELQWMQIVAGSFQAMPTPREGVAMPLPVPSLLMR